MPTVIRNSVIQLAVVLLLTGCATNAPVVEQGATTDVMTPRSQTDDDVANEDNVLAQYPSQPGAKIILGSGQFINQEAASRQIATPPSGDVSLNFENTSLEDVIKLILGDLLDANYIIDPTVKGTVTLKTSKPVSRDALLPILEELLKINNAAVIWSAGMYRVSPLSGAIRSAMPMRTQGGRDGAGYAVEILPLNYIAAKEMMKILEPMIPKENVILVDEHRNLLVVGGTSRELRGWRDTVEIFDVDWMSGNSVGVFPLHYAEARTIADELTRIIKEHMNAESASMIRIEPLERLNSILVLTPQQNYLEQIQEWVDRLDRVGDGPSVRLFTYAVKNRKAAELATVLTNVYGGGGGSLSTASTSSRTSLAPGMKPVKITNSSTSGDLPSTSDSSASAASAASTQNLALPNGGTVRIVADESNNAILVMASAQDYQVIESALKRLDVIEAQVLIEASILEVSLSDELSYGLEWYIKNKNVLNGREGQALLDLNSGSGIGAVIPGFSYSLVGGNGVEAVLNALASDSKLNVISSPSLMVLDNRTARITVGDQVPVRTETATTEGGVIIESIQFKDTGVQLEVKPRINAGDLITLDIRQDVTDAGAQDAATGQRSFRQRNIQSSIAIQSGETIMLGGLITENAIEGESGVPVLSKIPLLGALFGRSTESNRRTELVVLITPKVVRTSDDATNVTEEFRRRLTSMKNQDRVLAMP